MTDIREEFDRLLRAGGAQTAFLAQRLDEWGVALLNAIEAKAPVPSRIVQTSSKGTTDMPNVQLAQGQTDEITLAIADPSGTVIPGVVLDAGATVTVSNGAAATAVLSADQTSVLVTPSPAGGADVSVTVNGTVGGVTMTPDPTVYDVAPDVVAPVPAQIVQTPAPPTP